MPGGQCTRSLVCGENKHTSVVTTGTPDSPGIPARNGLRLISCSPRRRIRLVTVIRGLRFRRCPVGQLASANLTPATGARTTRLHRPQHSVSAKGFDGLSAVRLRAIRQLTGPMTRPAIP